MSGDDPVNLGRYRVLGELGRGAMGVVYLAEDPVLKRGVAVKVVGASDRQAEALARFKREAETAARLQHPNVVSIYDVGEEPGVGSFLAMEYVEGQSLQDRLNEGLLEPEELVSVLVQGALAIEAAHGAGVLHRDIKPGNFMLGKSGHLKLMDFGIARPAEATEETRLICTPAYASPELLAGEPPSMEADRWAFAVMAFQCLTGKVPFEGVSVAATLTAIGTAQPNLPLAMDPRVKQVFAKAFHKDSARRPRSLKGFVRDLLQVLPLEEEIRSKALNGLGESPLLQAPTRWPMKVWVAAGGSLVGLLFMLWLTGPLSHRRISVTCAPAGAQVRVGFRDLGSSPLREVRIPPFAKRIRIEHPGYKTYERELRPNETRVVVLLDALPIKVPILSDPAGAEVFLNGRLMGRTPLEELTIPGEGRHRLELRLAGHLAWVKTVGKGALPPEVIHLKAATEDETKSGPRAWLRRILK